MLRTTLLRASPRPQLARLARLATTTTPTPAAVAARPYSIKVDAASRQLRDIDPAALTVETTATPKPIPAAETLVFGQTFTDHMLSVEWTASTGWSAPRITPYQNLSLDPSTCVFHYAFECFEGMKAYRTRAGGITLFRPDRNMARLNRSSQRIALPGFSEPGLLETVARFVALEQHFVPAKRGYSLYLRPTMIGTQRGLGVGPPGSALLYVIASPVGPYYPTGFKAVSLEATSAYVRAWPGGVGNAKLGGNYAPCILPQLEAASRGFHQNLWLFGDEGYVTEVGTMNLFTAWVTADGTRELVTAPLDGTILEGVTRDCILALARQFLVPDGWTVSERKYTMAEVAQAAEDGRLLEAFGAGTAAVVSPVRRIAWDGGKDGSPRDIQVPLQEGKEAGPVAERMWKWMEERQYGDVESPWSYPVPLLKTQ